MVLKGKVLHTPHAQREKQVAPYSQLGCDAVSRNTNRDAEGTTPGWWREQYVLCRRLSALVPAGGEGRRGEEGMGEGRGEVAAGPGRAERCGRCFRAAPTRRAQRWEDNSLNHLPEAGLSPLKEASGSSPPRNLASQHPPHPASPHTPLPPGRLPATLTK